MLAPEPKTPAVSGNSGSAGPVLGGVEDAALQTLVEGGVALHPLLRQRVQLARGDQPGDAADPVVVGERVDQPFQPPRVDQHVVVGEGHQRGAARAAAPRCGPGPARAGPRGRSAAAARSRPAPATSSAVASVDGALSTTTSRSGVHACRRRSSAGTRPAARAGPGWPPPRSPLGAGVADGPSPAGDERPRHGPRPCRKRAPTSSAAGRTVSSRSSRTLASGSPSRVTRHRALP